MLCFFFSHFNLLKKKIVFFLKDGFAEKKVELRKKKEKKKKKMLIQQCINNSSRNDIKRTILILDGGGVRGLFSFEILRLMARSQPEPLSHLIHMIVGVSAGAIVGTMLALGILDDSKNNDDIMSDFDKNLSLMFSNRGEFRFPLLQPRYSGAGKKQVLQKLFGEKKLGETKVPLVILCSKVDGGECVAFKSWDANTKNLLLCDIVDASCAAHTYFPPVEVNNEWLADGGIFANKPLIEALLITMNYFDRGNFHFLSIGTLYAKTKKFKAQSVTKMGVLGWLAQGLINILLGVHDSTTEKLMVGLFGDKFLRLECLCDDITLDDVSERDHTRLYNAATVVWKQRGETVLNFIKPLPSFLNPSVPTPTNTAAALPSVNGSTKKHILPTTLLEKIEPETPTSSD